MSGLVAGVFKYELRVTDDTGGRKKERYNSGNHVEATTT